MSAAGYEAPHIPSTFSRPGQRRSSGTFPSNYDRPPNASARRSSPLPGVSRRPMDTYVPPRSDFPYRDGLPNVYRPNIYRPDYSSSYYSRSPSPDPHGHRSRLPEPEVWDRGSSWRPPPPIEAPNVWPERKNIPPSPTTSSRGRGSREDLHRMFEPSDSWKQSQVDRPSRIDHSPPSDRRFDRRPRNTMELSPDRLTRSNRPPTFMVGDHYRPPSKRETYSSLRSDYDSYRPASDDHRRNWGARYDPMSPANNHHRRDSGSVSFGRNSDRYESPFPPGRAASGKASLSPRPVISPMTSSPSWSTPHRESEHWSYPSAAKAGPPSRAPSRSSIASTHVSDRSSPAPAPPLSNGTMEHPVVPRDATKLLKAPEPKLSQKKPEDTQHEDAKVPNGTPVVPTLTTVSLPEATSAPKTILNSIPAKSVANLSADVSVTKHDSIISSSSATARTTVRTSESILDKTVTVTVSSATPPSNDPSTLPSTTLSHAIASVKSPPPPRIAENSTSMVREIFEIKQPKPSYSSTPVGSPMITPADINIPPPTHSPILTTPPPIHSESAPAPVQKDLPIPDEIPPFSEAKSTKDALRIVVMTRLLCDRQSREERINPVLASNLALANPPEANPIATPDRLIEKMFSGVSLQERIDSFIRTRPLLSQYLAKRNVTIEEKVARLRKEYLFLHERWIAHCNALNEQQKNLASEHENQHTGRTTRRSTAITDAVRSDFEMEQIIASLGYDDAMDPNHLSIRNLAKIPDMISVTHGHIDYLFDDTSNLVENPSEYYAPNTGIEDWTEEEKKIFLDKFAAYPKQFGIIADFLPHKSAAQCVDYYYLHKKQFIDFRRVVSQFAPNKRRRRGMGRKKGNGLLVDIAKHDMEVKGSGSASASPAVVARAPRGRKAVVAPDVKKAASAIRRSAVQFDDTPTSTPTPEPDSTRPRRRKAANNSGAPTSAVGSSSLSTAVTPSAPPSATASVPPSASASAAPSAAPTPRVSSPTPTPVVEHLQEPEQEMEPIRPIKRVRRTRKIKSAATVSDDHDFFSPPPEHAKEPLPVNGNLEGGISGRKDKVSTPSAASQWSEDDIKLFLTLLAQHGDDFRRIASSMPNKTTMQVTNFYKTQGAALDLARIVAEAPKRTPSPERRELTFTVSGTGGSGSTTSSLSSRQALPSNRALMAGGPPTILRPPPAIQSPGNPYPSSLGPSPPAAQPPMARLGISNAKGPPRPPEVSHRPSVYSPPNSARPFSSHTHHSIKEPEGGGANSSSNINLNHPPTHSPTSQAARPYLSVSSPPPTRPDFHSPLLPQPQTLGSVGPNTPSIVHSPTGLSSPKSLPMQPMQSYPAQQSDPAASSSSQYHRALPGPGPIPGGYYPYHTHPPHPLHPSPSHQGADPRSWAAGGTRLFSADGMSPFMNARRLSNGSGDNSGPLGAGAGIRGAGRNSYPAFTNPLTAGPGRPGSRPNGGYPSVMSSTAGGPPSGGAAALSQHLPLPSSPTMSPTSAAAATRYYYPGWTA